MRVPFPTQVNAQLVGSKPERKYTRKDGSEGLADAKLQFLVPDPNDGSATVLDIPASQVTKVAGEQALKELHQGQAYTLTGIAYIGGWDDSSFFRLTGIEA